MSERAAQTRAAVSVVPAWAWLTGIVVLSAVVRFSLALKIAAPWVFQDEMVYSDLARSLGTAGHFAIRQGAGTNGFGPLYPLLLSPTYAVFSSVPHAYLAMKAINAVLMSLAAVPVYVLGRRLLSPALALLASLLSVAIPSLAFTTLLMTENAFYPAVVATAVALILVLERPTLVRQGAFFGFGALACLTRAQGVMAVPALVTGVLLLALGDGWGAGRARFRRAFFARLARYAVTWAVLIVAFVGLVALEAARGRSLRSALGAYQGVALQHYSVASTLRWLIFHLGELDLYLGVVPFIALALVAASGLRPREQSPLLRAFAAGSVGLIFWLGITAAAYASQPVGQRIEERYFFYVAPLFLIALCLWVERGLPRPWPGTAVAVAVAAALPGTIPYDQLVTSDNVHDTMGFVPLIALEQTSLTPGSIPAAVILGALAAAVVALLLPRRTALLVPLLTLLWFAAVHETLQHRTWEASRASLDAGIQTRRDWIDRVVGSSADVALVTYAGTVAYPYWQNEFFNRSVRKVFTMSGPYDGLPRTQVTLRPSGLLVDERGVSARAAYVLASYMSIPRGRRLAADPKIGMELYRANGPIYIRELINGLYPDTWSGPTVTYTRYGCRPGQLTVGLLGDRDLHPAPQTIVATSGTTQLASFVYRPALAPRKLTVRLPSAKGVCSVTFSVPTAIPAQVIHTADTRQLGIRFLGFDYTRGHKPSR